MRQNSRIVAAVVVGALVVLASCGSSSGSSSGGASGGSSATSATSAGNASGAKKIDVCKIITPADAQKVVGGPVEVQAPAGGEPLASGVCIYKATGSGIRVRLLQVRVYPGPQFYGESTIAGAKSVDISGTDKAFAGQNGRGRSITVQFVKDGKTGIVNFTDTGSTPSGATVTNVQAVAQKLADAI